MQDRPTKHELLSAVVTLLQSDVMPALEGHLLFQVRVAVNLLGILEREMDQGAMHLQEDYAAWMDLLGEAPAHQDMDESSLQVRVRELAEQICEEIKRGAFEEPARRQALLTQLRGAVTRKLAIANPKFLARVEASEEP